MTVFIIISMPYPTLNASATARSVAWGCGGRPQVVVEATEEKFTIALFFTEQSFGGDREEEERPQ
jgi:hypothetical protein